MLLKWKVVALALPAAFLVACKDQPSAPQSVALKNHSMAADYTNNPLHGGPSMFRLDESFFAEAWPSADGKVWAVHTTFPLNWVGYVWDDAVCGPPGMGSMHIQYNIRHWDPTSSTDPGELHLNGIMDAWIVLLDNPAGGPDMPACNSQTIIASGWGRMNHNENNVWVTGRQQDAVTRTGEGLLTTPGGDAVKYNGHVHCVYNPGGKINWDCNMFVNFH